MEARPQPLLPVLPEPSGPVPHTSLCTSEGQRMGRGQAMPMHRLASGRTHSDVMFLVAPSDAVVNT